jgi:hypothetical protein
MTMKTIFVLLIIGSALLSLPSQQATSPVGRWEVKFTLLDSAERHLVFTAVENGDGSFQLLDTGPDDKPVKEPKAAAWSLSEGNLSVSGEVELQIGNCCRQTGTLIFKSKFKNGDSLQGKLIFVTNVDEEESAYKYRSTVGTFTASRLK